MANPASTSYQFGFDENDQVFTLSGSMRPQEASEINACLESLRACAMRATGMFYVNVRRLLQSNNVAFNGMASVLLEVCRERPDVNITITMSSVVGGHPENSEHCNERFLVSTLWSTTRISTLDRRLSKTVRLCPCCGDRRR